MPCQCQKVVCFTGAESSFLKHFSPIFFKSCTAPLWNAANETACLHSCLLAEYWCWYHQLTRKCGPCNKHQRMPQKEQVHLWVMPDKPWDCVHIDRAVSFCGHYCLVMMDDFSKYPFVHQMSTITTKATLPKLKDKWVPATVASVIRHLLFEVQNSNGHTWLRHLDQLQVQLPPWQWLYMDWNVPNSWNELCIDCHKPGVRHTQAVKVILE